MATYRQIPHHIASVFDEFGQLLGVPRLPLESNVSYRRRLLLAGANWCASTKQGLVNAISAELDLRIYDTQDRAFFALTHVPLLEDPETGDALVFSVYVGETQFSDFDITGSPSNAYKLWTAADGSASRILEFKTVPGTGAQLRVEYYRYEDGIIRRWTDESVTDDERFLAMSTESPGTEDIEIYELTDEDFQNTHLIGSDNLPNAAFRGIVEQLHNTYPLLWNRWIWGTAFWDITDSEETGIEFHQNIFDLSQAGLITEDFDSGVGYGPDCSVIGARFGMDVSQRAEISPGFFYLRNKEFFLFGQKSHDPSGDFFATSGPIVVTLDPGGDEHYATPFARVWQKGATDKLRQAVNLSGEYIYVPGEWEEVADPWFSVNISGEIELSGSYTIYDVAIEYDGGGAYTCPIDFNPIHSPVHANRLLAIVELPVSAEILALTYVDGYCKREHTAAYDDLDVSGALAFPDQDITIRLDVTDARGSSVLDPTIYVRLTAEYNTVEVATTDVYLDRDGSAIHTFADLANRSAISAKDLILSGDVRDAGGSIGVGYELNVPIGCPK